MFVPHAFLSWREEIVSLLLSMLLVIEWRGRESVFFFSRVPSLWAFLWLQKSRVFSKIKGKKGKFGLVDSTLGLEVEISALRIRKRK